MVPRFLGMPHWQCYLPDASEMRLDQPKSRPFRISSPLLLNRLSKKLFGVKVSISSSACVTYVPCRCFETLGLHVMPTHGSRHLEADARGDRQFHWGPECAPVPTERNPDETRTCAPEPGIWMRRLTMVCMGTTPSPSTRLPKWETALATIRRLPATRCKGGGDAAKPKASNSDSSEHVGHRHGQTIGV